MWTVVYVTNELNVAKNIKNNLENEYMKVRIKRRALEGFEPETFEILVPAAEVALALAQVG